MSRFAGRRSAVLAAMFPSVALGLVNAFYVEPLQHYSRLAFWLVDTVQWVVVPIFVAVLLYRRGGIAPRDYGFGAPGSRLRVLDTVGVVLFVSAAFWLAYEPVKQVAWNFFGSLAGFDYGAVIPSVWSIKFLTVIYLAGTAAFVEEAVFRGLPWLYVCSFEPARWRVPAYVVVTAVLFAATHSEQGPHGVIAALSVGLVAALLYAKVRNLWPFVVGHFVTDVAAFWSP